MTGQEQLSALGYPCRPELAAVAKVEPWLSLVLANQLGIKINFPSSVDHQHHMLLQGYGGHQ